MGRPSWRNKLVEEKMINKIDRGRYEGPKGNIDEPGEKKRLHECAQGQWVRQVLKGAGNLGPNLRVIDPKGGILENRQGMRTRLSPRTQVMVQN